MKKFYAILVVLALTVISSVAMAEVTVSGSIDIRSLSLDNYVDQSSKAATSDKVRLTGERIRLNIDAKHEGVKGRLTLENDWEYWGTEGQAVGSAPSTLPAGSMEAKMGMNPGKGIGIREGWIDFTIPGAGPAHVKVGHQFLQLGNGWFFRNMKYGSDAWVVGLPGKNTIAFVDVKATEGASTQSDDVDAYVLLDNFKIDDTKTVGAYIVHLVDNRGVLGNSAWFPAGAGYFKEGAIDTLGLWFNGKLGPINLQAEIDLQSGKAKAANGANPDVKFKGNQIVLQANMPIDPLTINATIARGSGDDTNSTAPEIKSFVPALDADPHYTFVYEYFTKTACAGGGGNLQAKNTGFCNTTALGLGAAFAVSKSVNLGANLWMLKAVEKVSLNGAAASDAIGNEIDVQAKFKLYDQLTWDWTVGYMMPGKAYDYAAQSADEVLAIQGILSYKF